VKSTGRRGNVQALPRREVLETLARQYHHLQNEHKRAQPESSVRRRIEDRLVDVRERFDRLLDEWVPEDDLRQAWREHLHHRAPTPEGPAPIRPLVFRGESDAGSVVEVYRRDDDEFDAEIDGSLVARIAAKKDFSLNSASAHFRLDHGEFHETFAASPEALQALADFAAAAGQSPPWEYAAELLDDGMIDTHAAVTPRGRRALARLRE
jgi:hypothetical protein